LRSFLRRSLATVHSFDGGMVSVLRLVATTMIGLAEGNPCPACRACVEELITWSRLLSPTYATNLNVELSLVSHLATHLFPWKF
jgi:hypothetical protein